jgi:hypothetical protein
MVHPPVGLDRRTIRLSWNRRGMPNRAGRSPAAEASSPSDICQNYRSLGARAAAAGIHR